MPYPENLKTAKQVEDVVRQNHAVPATIAIISGKVHIGLSDASLEIIAQAGASCVKCSRRNLPQVLSQKSHGSTTVAATMYLAHMAGLKIFVTGGIGGVHRGAEETWDVSADLIELGRTPITVICAGAKSILDISKTLEYLETQGVPVIGYGTSKFPAFFSPSSGFDVMARCDSPKECADFIKAGEKLRLENGNLIAVPLAEEELASNAEKAIQIALEEAKTQGIAGSKVTPFLLKRVNELSEGESLKANIALIKQNAKIGSLIACEYYRKHTITIVGGVLQDTICQAREDFLQEGEASGVVKVQAGGVGFNILKSCGLFEEKCCFISQIGEDTVSEFLKSEVLKHTSSALLMKCKKSSQYIGIFAKDGSLNRAIVDRHDINFTRQELESLEVPLKMSKLLILDTNITSQCLSSLAQLAKAHNIPILVDPTCDWNCPKILESGILQDISYITPNFNELKALVNPFTGTFIEMLNHFCMKYPWIVVIAKNGKENILVQKGENVLAKSEVKEIEGKNVNGLGDILTGAIAASISRQETLSWALEQGLKHIGLYLRTID